MAKFLKNQVRPVDSSKIEKYPKSADLVVVQQPVKARVSGRKETKNSSRRLVDPQPIVQLKLDYNGRNIIDYSLGIYFVRATIECLGFPDQESFMSRQRKARNNEDNEDGFDVLRGTTTVTAQFYKESPYVACCVFDNLSVRFKGEYRLRFDLYEIRLFTEDGGLSVNPRIIHWENATKYSSKFTVFTDSSFDGLEASPMLNEQLKKAGCKIRTRKPKSSLMNDYKISKPISSTTVQQFFSPYNQVYSTPVPLYQVIPEEMNVYSISATPVEPPQEQYLTPRLTSETMDSYFTQQENVLQEGSTDFPSFNYGVKFGNSYILDSQISQPRQLDFGLDEMYSNMSLDAVPRSEAAFDRDHTNTDEIGALFASLGDEQAQFQPSFDNNYGTEELHFTF